MRMTWKSSNKKQSPKKKSPGRRASEGQAVAEGIRSQGIEALYNFHALGDELFEGISCAPWRADST